MGQKGGAGVDPSSAAADREHEGHLPGFFWLMSSTEIKTPHTAIPTAPRNANLNPSTSAAPSGIVPASASERAAERGIRIASPSTVPIWAAEFNSPEARPCSAPSAAAIPEAVEATEAHPRPEPMRTKPGIRYQRYPPPCGLIPKKQTAPAAIASSPHTIVAFRPTRVTIRGPSRDPPMTARLKGGNTRPASAGGYPRTCCT